MSAHKQTGSHRSRQRAVATVALLIAGWIVGDQFFRHRPRDDHGSNRVSPKLFIDISKADGAELRLLPQVGAKTSQRWLEERDSDDFSPPADVRELEELPQVGPKRAAELAPYLLNEDAMRSVTESAKARLNNTSRSREQNHQEDFQSK